MLQDTIGQLRLLVRTNALAPLLEQFIAYLVSRGNAASALREYVFAVEHFGRWLRRRPLNQATVWQFMHRHLPVCRCRAPVIRNVRRNRIALNHLLEMSGAAAARFEFPRGFVGDLLRRYEERLVTVQGLAAETVHRRLTAARTMLTRLRVQRPCQLVAWTPERIECYVSSEARRYQPSTGHNIACATRSLLRFLLQEGLIRRDLSAAVPTFAHWRLAALPETLREEEVARLINMPDVQTSIGLRDRAMLLCMSELGLRASEVAGLELDGVNLTTNVLRLRRSKKRELTELPMTRKLAWALKAYLRHGRPTCTSREVFVLHHPPVGKPISPRTICGMVWSLGRRSGMQRRISAHVFRHSVASRMLSAGARLKQIADLLGHQSIDTTTIYAKVDLNALAQVALPWPGAKEVQP
jgi:site-specific recombinase XerD